MHFCEKISPKRGEANVFVFGIGGQPVICFPFRLNFPPFGRGGAIKSPAYAILLNFDLPALAFFNPDGFIFSHSCSLLPICAIMTGQMAPKLSALSVTRPVPYRWAGLFSSKSNI